MKTKTFLTLAMAAWLSAVVAAEQPNTDQHRIADQYVKKETIAQARAANKMILTAGSAFGDRHIAGFLTKNFIVQYDAEAQHPESYNVYDSNGRLVHRVTGDPRYPYELAVKIKRGLDSETQYCPLLKRFNSGERSATLLKNVIIGASDAGDTEHAARAMRAYIKQLPVVPSESERAFVTKYTNHTSDPGFAYLLASGTHMNEMADLIFQDVFLPQVSQKQVHATTWLEALKDRYPEALAPQLDRMMVELLERRGNKEALDAFVSDFIQRQQNQLNTAQRAYYKGLVSE